MAEEFDGRPSMRRSGRSTILTTGTSRPTSARTNVLLDGGVPGCASKRRRGHANDDPTKPETDWATGFLTSTTQVDAALRLL